MSLKNKQGKSEGFDSCGGVAEKTQINPAEMKAIVPGIHYPFVLKWFDHQINDLP